MNAAPPIPCVFDGEAFRPLPNFLRVARQHYGEGEVEALAPHGERSKRSHDHFFACVHEAWQSLPEHLTAQFPNEETLRAHALILTGHCNVEVAVCQFKTEAARTAQVMRRGEEYAIVTIDGKTVTRLTAKSQSLRAMGGKEAFQRSKDDVLGFLADLIGVAPEELSRARAA